MNELFRQSIHVLLGLLLFALAFLLPTPIAIGINLIGIFLLVGALFLKAHASAPELLAEFFLHTQRGHEESPFLAPLFFLAGTTLALVLFPLHAALAGILTLTFGDSASTLFGKKFGKTRIGNKTLEGTLAGIGAATLALNFYFQNPIQALLVAIAGMMAELLPMDDNASIPVAATAASALIR
ncbi:MAG: hypothetical protein HY917_02615 [Candidatus Diapherotrites archaeon]|nr:hypothetical protein [Candidatus Diapherotrites archaeon]